jgi:hypothetical protein
VESRHGTRYGAAFTTEVPAMAQKLTAAQRRALKREAVGWDELSDEDFARLFATGQPVKVRVRRPPPKTLTIALDEQTLNRLKRIAQRKQVRPPPSRHGDRRTTQPRTSCPEMIVRSGFTFQADRLRASRASAMNAIRRLCIAPGVSRLNP